MWGRLRDAVLIIVRGRPSDDLPDDLLAHLDTAVRRLERVAGDEDDTLDDEP
jgi:hypothetical protein